MINLTKPQTKAGKRSVIFIIAMPILFYIGMSSVGFYEGVPAGSTMLEDIIVRPGVALPQWAAFACGIMAFFTGFSSIRKKGERSIFVYISTVLGFLLMVFLALEVLFPH